MNLTVLFQPPIAKLFLRLMQTLSTHNVPLVLNMQNTGATSADLPTSAYLLCSNECRISIEQDGDWVAI